jgi:hypothetical protein
MERVMGREADAEATYRDTAGATHVHLDGAVLILSGDVRARIPRDSISKVVAAGDTLSLMTPDGPLVLTLRDGRAATWADALVHPAPTLAAKLGLDGTRTVFVIGAVSDPALEAAIMDARTPDPATATFLLAEVLTLANLDSLMVALAALPLRPIWCANAKGRTVFVPEAAIRARLRDAGWIDSKTASVSDRFSATRYARRKD